MAVACTNLTSGGSETDATSYATASIAPTANQLVLVYVKNRATAPNAVAPTITGAGMTWVQIATVPSSTGNSSSTLFRGLSASPGSGALTIDFGSNTQQRCNWIIDTFTGMSTTGTNGSGAIVQSATNILESSNTTMTITLGAFSNAGNATYGAVSQDNATSTVTPGSGFTEIVELNPTSNCVSESEFKNSNDTSVDWTFSNSDFFIDGVAVEIAIPSTATTSTYRSLLGVGI